MTGFVDLIYDDACLPIIREAFPHVAVEDASDFIHENRVEISLPESDRRAYIKHAIREGYADVSLTIQLATMCIDDGSQGELRSILDELKAERTVAATKEKV